ncbi:ABC transporter permease [Aureimonas leprariae]|uniref:ABC transporter permease n=2 Tax=Plantimonas leprariae TaxID=2615207 RepID=A0A7V7PK76_9HYPH|nr:ABC transporter permease [Aureimonas leprariae]
MPEARPDGFAAALRDLRDGMALTELWLYLGWRDVRRHYSRSALGPFWLTLSMGVLIGSLGLLYSRIFGMDIHEYLPFLAVGFIMWNLISGVIGGACHVFTGASGYIRQIRLPLSVHMLKFVWNQLVVFLHNFAIYVVVAIGFGLRPGVGVLLAVPAITLIALNGLFVAMILGPLSARFRDVPMIVGNVVQVMFFMTPVIWHPEQLADRSWFVQLNPFYHFIEIARDPLLGDTVRAGNWIAVLAITAVLGVSATAFYGRFRTRIAYWA